MLVNSPIDFAGSDATSGGEVAVLALVGTLAVAVIGAWATLATAKRESRRILYSEAVRAALAWNEMVFRVRRRAEDQVQDLVGRFHEMQEDLAYYSAWIGSDSLSMQRSYSRLVASVKEETEGLITEAWGSPLRPPPGNRLPDDVIPDLGDFVEGFLRDVRARLSPWLLPRLGVWVRNRSRGS